MSFFHHWKTYILNVQLYRGTHGKPHIFYAMINFSNSGVAGRGHTEWKTKQKKVNEKGGESKHIITGATDSNFMFLD